MIGPWSPQSHSTDVDRVGLTKSLGQPPQSVDSWPMGEERQRTALFKSITVAVDGSHASMHAFEFALGLARNFRSSLALVTVVPTPPPYGAPFFPSETWASLPGVLGRACETGSSGPTPRRYQSDVRMPPGHCRGPDPPRTSRSIPATS